MLFTLYNRKSIPPFGAPVLNKQIMLRHTLDGLSCLKGWTKYETIHGGAMNNNYKVTVNNKTLVLRILGNNTQLNINRRNEVYNLGIVSKSKIGSKLIGHDLEKNSIITEYIEGKTLSNEDIKFITNLDKVVLRMKEMHQGEKFLENFNVFDKFNQYYNKCIDNNYKLPKGFSKKIKYMKKIQAIIDSLPKVSVPCHNDLWAPNIILDNKNNIRFIDFEFSGNNDPLFEIGNFWNESELDISDLQDIIRKYYGLYDSRKTAIAELYSIYANCMWSLWGTIQKNTSKIDYDYQEFIDHRFEKASAKLNRKYLNSLISKLS